ncbi:hypothetical protein BD777DRAFT_22676 [Yarrowia lipolytica]|jgi:hypothetical protein|uniref:Uncharacterized protein n=1 Tax=Yarrowia lipolytica TaxID=4952 RepID=A0A1D8NNN7_YARLL|nr:hypothetical protein YALI1_F20547g [Yarrowia lipolytica]RMJ00472.1 hypothetical protein BD777DRAFT_22676 [Yarrowia lipolytica]
MSTVYTLHSYPESVTSYSRDSRLETSSFHKSLNLTHSASDATDEELFAHYYCHYSTYCTSRKVFLQHMFSSLVMVKTRKGRSGGDLRSTTSTGPVLRSSGPARPTKQPVKMGYSCVHHFINVRGNASRLSPTVESQLPGSSIYFTLVSRQQEKTRRKLEKELTSFC